MTKRTSHRHSPRSHTMAMHTASWLVQQALLSSLLQAGSRAAEGDVPLLVERAAVASAPLRMSGEQATDPATRERLTVSFQHYLDAYRTMVQDHGGEQPLDDVGRVVAFFVAANLHALHGIDADTALLIPLERQLRTVARTASKWDHASTAQRQFFFEQTATVSMLMCSTRATAASQGPAAMAQVRAAARRYLEQMLGLNPDLLTLTADGLATRLHKTHRAAATAGLHP